MKIVICLLIILFILIFGVHKMIYYKPNKEKVSMYHINPMTVVVIGSGLAGLVSAITISELGHRVIIIEKESHIGGNSIKASSGINATGTKFQADRDIKDSSKSFVHDTTKSSKNKSQLTETLISNSKSALKWLEDHDLKIDDVIQLGGHSFPRTHRSSTYGSIGRSLIKNLEKYLSSDNILLFTDTKVNSIDVNKKNTIESITYNNNKKLYCNAVIIATGGFGANAKLIKKYRPDLSNLPTTNGSWTKGDGFKLCTKVKPSYVDMDKIQVHPTSFIDPNDPSNKHKILAGEMLRGKGGILLDLKGKRFCNELAQRDEIVKIMKGDIFFLIIQEKSTKEIEKEIKFYESAGLMKKVQNINELSQLTKIDYENLRNELKIYDKNSIFGKDKFGKTFFPDTPIIINDPFYVGLVTPAVHYCMGGIKIDNLARVLDKKNEPIPHLFAVGEVTGGLHGNNRLGGNSLLECVVFGRIAGENSIKYGSTKDITMVSDKDINSRIKIIRS